MPSGDAERENRAGEVSLQEPERDKGPGRN